MKTVWLLWRIFYEEPSEKRRRELIGVYASFAAATCASGGMKHYDIVEVQVIP